MARGQWQTYKKSGALQVSFIPFKTGTDGGYKDARSGAVYMEFAPCKDWDNKVYDWSDAKKIKFSLGIADIQSLLESDKLNNDLNLYHVPGGNTPGAKKPGKKLTIQLNNDSSSKFYQSRLLKIGDEATSSSVMLPLSYGEWLVFIELCKSSLPQIIGWYGF